MPWWKHSNGLPDFHGLKICWDGNQLEGFPDIRRVEIASPTGTDLQFGNGKIGAGGNSGFQALNLAINFGARKIILIGFDMMDRTGAHWYGRNMWHGANNPTDDNFRRWIANFSKASVVLKRRGIEVVNASPNSALDCFLRLSISEALRELT